LKGSNQTAKRLSRWALEILGFVALYYLIHLWQIQDTAKGMAPELSGQLLKGGQFDLAMSSSTQIVHFWATWCPVCKLESDTLDSLAKDYPLVTVAMNSGDQSSIREYLDENQLSFPVIPDPDGRLSAAWGVKGVPTTFIVNREGKIRFVEVGYTTGLGLRSRYWWAAGNHLR